MDIWAIITTGGKQYKVREGETVIIEKLALAKDGKAIFDRVLVIGGDKNLIGSPHVAKAQVLGKVIENFKEAKVKVVKFKSKSRYLRTTGHRQSKTRVLIEKIQLPVSTS